MPDGACRVLVTAGPPRRQARPAHPDRRQRSFPARPLRVISYPRRARARPAQGDDRHAVLPRPARRATAAGADDAILVDDEGRIFEGATSNMFLVRGGGLVTPPAEGAILPGVLRAKVEELAGAHGIPVVEAFARVADLRPDDGMLLTSSVRGIVPVASVDGRDAARRRRARSARLRALVGAAEAASVVAFRAALPLAAARRRSLSAAGPPGTSSRGDARRRWRCAPRRSAPRGRAPRSGEVGASAPRPCRSAGSTCSTQLRSSPGTGSPDGVVLRVARRERAEEEEAAGTGEGGESRRELPAAAGPQQVVDVAGEDDVEARRPAPASAANDAASPTSYSTSRPRAARLARRGHGRRRRVEAEHAAAQLGRQVAAVAAVAAAHVEQVEQAAPRRRRAGRRRATARRASSLGPSPHRRPSGRVPLLPVAPPAEARADPACARRSRRSRLRQAAPRLQVLLGRPRDHVGAAARGRAPSCPSRASRGSRARTACRSWAGSCPAS